MQDANYNVIALREGGTIVERYEYDPYGTVRVVRGGSGSIKRLSAAVVLNDRQVTDAAGKVTQVAMSPEQIAQMTALVKETIGFSKERGDSVNLLNAAFASDKSVMVDSVISGGPADAAVQRAVWPARAPLDGARSLPPLRRRGT